MVNKDVYITANNSKTL